VKLILNAAGVCYKCVCVSYLNVFCPIRMQNGVKKYMCVCVCSGEELTAGERSESDDGGDREMGTGE